jgi:hypothetical protein
MRARTWPYQVPNGGSLRELGSKAQSVNANFLFIWHRQFGAAKSAGAENR